MVRLSRKTCGTKMSCSSAELSPGTCWLFLFVALRLPELLFGRIASTLKPTLETCEEKTIGISVNPADATYTIFDRFRSRSFILVWLQESIIVD
jgi:hypothetical protein